MNKFSEWSVSLSLIVVICIFAWWMEQKYPRHHQRYQNGFVVRTLDGCEYFKNDDLNNGRNWQHKADCFNPVHLMQPLVENQ